MGIDRSIKGTSLDDRVREEMADSFDEELEMEIDDERLNKLLADAAQHPERETLDRRIYFKELFRLQGELVKLQDWVAHEKRRIVIVFEGRDAAGQGRRDQAHHTTAQSADLPGRSVADSERTRAHTMVFPALYRASAGRR